MSSQRQFEAYQVTPPYQGSTGLVAQANFAFSQSARAIDLTEHFGRVGAGHYFTIQADCPGGGKMYFAVAPHDKQPIQDLVQGSVPSGMGVCYPVPDSTSFPFTLQGGRTIGSGSPTMGYATNIDYATGAFLWLKMGSYLPSGASQTGFARVLRSSVGPTQGLEQFPPKGFF